MVFIINAISLFVKVKVLVASVAFAGCEVPSVTTIKLRGCHVVSFKSANFIGHFIVLITSDTLSRLRVSDTVDNLFCTLACGEVENEIRATLGAGCLGVIPSDTVLRQLLLCALVVLRLVSNLTFRALVSFLGLVF